MIERETHQLHYVQYLVVLSTLSIAWDLGDQGNNDDAFIEYEAGFHALKLFNEYNNQKKVA